MWPCSFTKPLRPPSRSWVLIILTTGGTRVEGDTQFIQTSPQIRFPTPQHANKEEVTYVNNCQIAVTQRDEYDGNQIHVRHIRITDDGEWRQWKCGNLLAKQTVCRSRDRSRDRGGGEPTCVKLRTPQAIFVTENNPHHHDNCSRWRRRSRHCATR